MNDESGESTEPMEEVPLGEISDWSTERSRKLIRETSGSTLEETICYYAQRTLILPLTKCGRMTWSSPWT